MKVRLETGYFTGKVDSKGDQPKGKRNTKSLESPEEIENPSARNYKRRSKEIQRRTIRE